MHQNILKALVREESWFITDVSILILRYMHLFKVQTVKRPNYSSVKEDQLD